MRALDGKLRLTDCADSETMLRLVQSVPSPHAEPFKLWLAQAGNEQLEAMHDPERAIADAHERAVHSYVNLGYSRDWADDRVDAIEVRLALTRTWQERGGERFAAILTALLHEHAFGLTPEQHKRLKQFAEDRDGRMRGELRDAMTRRELAIIRLAETIAQTEHEEQNSQGFEALRRDVEVAGDAAGIARRALEERTGRAVVVSTDMRQQRGLWSGEDER